MSWEAQMVARAAAFAAKAHGKQKRDDMGDPYFIHVAEVADTLARREPFDPFLVSAALLHDTVEDTSVTLDDIHQFFGPETTDIVAEVTDPDDLETKNKAAWQAEHMKTASVNARLIKLADKASNVAEMIDAPARRRPTVADMKSYLKGARLVIDQCRGIDERLEADFDAVAARADVLIKELEKKAKAK